MKTVLLVLLATSSPLLADSLEMGSVYFDSRSTLSEVVALAAKKDNAGILQLIQSGHVVTLPAEIDVEVLSSGSDPESPAEFRFLTDPTTYWTLTKFIAKSPTAPIPSPTPSATPSDFPTPTPTSTPTPTPTPSVHRAHPHLRNPADNPPDAPPPLEKDKHGPRLWHLVGGTWKWYYPKNSSELPRRHHTTVRRAEPVEPVQVEGAIPVSPLYRDTLP